MLAPLRHPPRTPVSGRTDENMLRRETPYALRPAGLSVVPTQPWGTDWLARTSMRCYVPRKCHDGPSGLHYVPVPAPAAVVRRGLAQAKIS
eukprot:6733185-Prymnesium_polylepis.1